MPHDPSSRSVQSLLRRRLFPLRFSMIQCEANDFLSRNAQRLSLTLEEKVAGTVMTLLPIVQ